MQKYVQKFVDDALIQGFDVTPHMKNPILTIQIRDLNTIGSSTIGLCQTGTNTRAVSFDTDFWNRADETQRELVVHHELGHCVLGRSHRSDKLSDGRYASLMYPTIMGDSPYLNNYDYYQTELFTYEAFELPDGATLPDATYVCE